MELYAKYKAYFQIGGIVLGIISFILFVRWMWKKVKGDSDKYTDLPDGGSGLPENWDGGNNNTDPNWMENIASSLDAVLNKWSSSASEMEIAFQKYMTLAFTDDMFVDLNNYYNQYYAPEGETLASQINGWGTTYLCLTCSTEWRDKVRSRLKKLEVK